MTDETLADPALGPEDFELLGDLAETAPVKPPPDETTNIAEGMDAEKLTKIGVQVIEELKQDEEDMSEWQTQHAEWLRLYAQKDTPVEPPFDYSSTESMPIMAEACNQFAARAFKAFFPNKNIIKATPIGNAKPQDWERGQRIGKHLSWQLLAKDRTYKRNKRRLLLSAAIHGSHFTKTYFDPVRKRNVVSNVRAADLIVPFGTGPRDIEDLERKSHLIYKSLAWATNMANKDWFLHAPERMETPDTRETSGVESDIEGVHQTGIDDEDNQREVCIVEQHRLLDIDGEEGVFKPYIVWVDRQTEKVLRLSPRWEEVDGEIVPIEHFTHYPFVENPDGFYALGMGHFIGDINKAVNKVLRQIMDAAMLANVGNHSGFIDGTLAPAGGDMHMDLGIFKKLNGAGNIKDGLFQFNFPGPQPVLAEIMGILMGRADRLASVTEMISGQPERVMQPTVVLALIEQAMEQYSAIYEGLFDAWSDELQKIYRLNRLYMDEKDYFTALDAPLEAREQVLEVMRADYADDMQIMPVADPKMATDQQRLTRAEAEHQVGNQYYVQQIQLYGPSPAYREPMYNLARRYMQAMQIDDLEEVLVKPPPPEPPNRIDDPKLENVHFLMPQGERPPEVFADQDHLDHNAEHRALQGDPRWGQNLTKEGGDALERHIQEHIAMQYAVEEGAINDQGPTDPVAQVAGDPGSAGGNGVGNAV